MCGICGFMGLEDKGLISDMMSVLEHRGPDDSGMYVDGGVCLGHRRLSIIDLSQQGRQPISNEDGSIWVTYNGEIYNFRQLKSDLEAAGHRFQSNSDTEVIVHAYEQWGVGCLNKFNGMFAFGLWDSINRRLFLARDRFGIKPLFYGFFDDVFFFASEIKSILQYPGYAPSVNLDVLHNFLGFGYCKTFCETLFSGIKKLPASHFMIVEGDSVSIERYWGINVDIGGNSETYYSSMLLDLLKSSVSRRLVSDVPVGVYLSGGLDSSTIVALMSEKQDEVNTFSVGFGEYGVSELQYCRVVADEFSTNHHELVVEPCSKGLLEGMIRQADEPLVDFAMIPVYLMSKLAKKDVSVVLTGEGGDETQAGYIRYLSHLRLARLGRMLPVFFKSFLSRYVGHLPESEFKSRFFYASYLLNDPSCFLSFRRRFRDDESEDLYSRDIFNRLSHSAGVDMLPPDLLTDEYSYLDQMLLADIYTLLSCSYLTKTDRATMAASVEARVPFLDHDLVEFMFTVPGQMKIGQSQTKNLFRKAVSDILPREIVRRPKKGFGVPMDLWLVENREFIDQLLDTNVIRRRGFLNPDYVSRVRKKAYNYDSLSAKKLWVLATFELWGQIYIDGGF